MSTDSTVSSPAESELIQQVLSGENAGLRLLAASGVLPLSHEELVWVQVRLATSDDTEVAETARDSLSKVDVRLVQDYLRQDADLDVVRYFIVEQQSASLSEIAIQRRDLPVEIALEAAPRLSAELQEILLLRQDLIVDCPEILDELETNPELSTYAKRRIGEYRQHLVGPTLEAGAVEALAEPVEEEEPEELSAIAAILAEDEDTTDEEAIEFAAEIDQVLETVEAEGEYDEKTGLTEGQVRALSAPLRVRLARGASRTLRGILLKDPNPQVAVMVLKASPVTESEAEQLAANRHVCDEVLTEVSKRREWITKYNIVHNLVKNPRTPVGIAVRFISRLSVRDLGHLKRDRNVPDAVRQHANRLHRVKSR